MPECIECKDYTKFVGGLCTTCYYKKSSRSTSKRNFDEFDDDFEDVSIGLTDKEYNYRYGMIKGRIAETLIQELFLSLGYNVFRYGMEH